MSWSAEDEQFMRAALAEARLAGQADEVPVGAVVVRNGEIIGRGLNRPIQDFDPTAHAEIVAIRAAVLSADRFCDPAFSPLPSLEPCPMCVGAMLHARIGRLVFGAYDPKAGAAGSALDLCDDRRLNHRLEVNGGLLEEECSGLLQKFFAARR